MFVYNFILAIFAVNSFSKAALTLPPLKNCKGHNCSTVHAIYSTTQTSKPATRGTGPQSVPAKTASKLSKNTTSPCSSNPCLSGGTCDVIGNGYICACPVGYDPNDNCHPCLHGWFGENCLRQCGACKRIKIFHDSMEFCDHEKGCIDGCVETFYPKPECDRLPCEQDPDGIDPCMPGKCVNNRCICPAGLGGVQCHKKRFFREDEKCESIQQQQQQGVPRTNAASTLTCSGGGTCYVQDGQQVCLCPPGMLALEENPTACVRKCVNLHVTCMNGWCVKNERCNCHDGYTGAQCDERCPVDKFGKDCTKDCGYCAVLPCDERRGYCPGKKCLEGFRGNHCNDVKAGYDLDYEPAILARGNMAYKGEFRATFTVPTSDDYKAVAEATKKLLNTGCQIITGANANFVVITAVYPGSVGVSYVMSLNPQNVSSTANVRRALTKALRQAAKDVPPPLPGYSLNVNSIKVANVEQPGTDDGRVEETSTVVLDRSGLITAAVFTGIVIICIPMIVCLFVRQTRKRKRAYALRGYNTSWYQRRTSSRQMRSA